MSKYGVFSGPYFTAVRMWENTDQKIPRIWTLFTRCRSVGTWAAEKKSVIVSVSSLQSHNGFRVSWKQCLNLWSQRWLRLRCNLVRSLIPYGLWILKILFAQGRMKFRRHFLKIERLPEFLTFESNLIYLDIVEGKNESLK